MVAPPFAPAFEVECSSAAQLTKAQRRLHRRRSCWLRHVAYSRNEMLANQPKSMSSDLCIHTARHVTTTSVGCQTMLQVSGFSEGEALEDRTDTESFLSLDDSSDVCFEEPQELVADEFRTMQSNGPGEDTSMFDDGIMSLVETGLNPDLQQYDVPSLEEWLPMDTLVHFAAKDEGRPYRIGIVVGRDIPQLTYKVKVFDIDAIETVHFEHIEELFDAILTRLEKHPHLNGRHCFALEYDERSHRICVELDDERRVAVKPQCLDVSEETLETYFDSLSMRAQAFC